MGTRELYPRALLGYRTWLLSEDGERLMSLAAGSDIAPEGWRSGTNSAQCHRPHRAPSRKCDCGFNAYYSDHPLLRLVDTFGNSRGSVVGAISAWGDVELHDVGFRSSKARVLAIRLPSLLRPFARRRARRAAALMEVPVYRRRRRFEKKARVDGVVPAEPSLGPSGSRKGQRLFWRSRALLGLTVVALVPLMPVMLVSSLVGAAGVGLAYMLGWLGLCTLSVLTALRLEKHHHR